ncbi:hypothetical protein [Algoriphagus sp.]|uniref:hypothetical protein n=1 Tax=Algoriphagus sp. TaxID=1872435 RepID=UPI003F704734
MKPLPGSIQNGGSLERLRRDEYSGSICTDLKDQVSKPPSVPKPQQFQDYPSGAEPYWQKCEIRCDH